MTFHFGEDRLNTTTLYNQTAKGHIDCELPPKSTQRIELFREIVEQALRSGKTYYGINTGFGYLSDVRIEDSKLIQLQENLVRSHACGVGEYVEPGLVRALLFLRAHTFSLGYSGVSLDCVEKIIEFLRNDILPVVPVKGSVGASGDLAPLAHLARGLMGEGQVLHKGELQPARVILGKLGIEPLKLKPKEGLSLINGTHFMSCLASYAIEESRVLCLSSEIICALSLDAMRGTLTAFDSRIHEIRPHLGQIECAERMRELFATDDPIVSSHASCLRVQDPYSFRCVPQVHGATLDTLNYVQGVVDRELNSVTDNPLCFPNGDVLSGGNFHGQPLALAMDFLGIAMAEIGSISERRTEKLTNPNMSGLPAFLTRESGLNSGFMIPHVVAAALVSENKVLSHPASVDSIPTSADKEDHVSMGPIAAVKCRKILKNLSSILAIELLAACEGLELLRPLQPNVRLLNIYDTVRKVVPSMERDRSLHDEIRLLSDWILDGGLLKC